MSPGIRTAIQVLASAALVAAVLVAMWRLPRSDRFVGWAPALALLSAWTGLLGLLGSLWIWTPWAGSPDGWLVGLFLILDPAAAAAGILVLWIHRGHTYPAVLPDAAPPPMDPVALRCVQALAGLAMGLLSVALGYAYVMSHKSLFTPVGQ